MIRKDGIKKILLLIIILFIISACDKNPIDPISTKNNTSKETETPLIINISIKENILLKDIANNFDLKIDFDNELAKPSKAYEHVIQGSDYDIDLIEDNTFIISINDHLNQLNESIIYSDELILKNYDYSWLYKTETKLHPNRRFLNLTTNIDGSLIDPNDILNGINDDTILYYDIISCNGTCSDKYLEYQKDLCGEDCNLISGIRYKDSYLFQVLKGNLIHYDLLECEKDYPNYSNLYTRFYKVTIDKEHDLVIKLISYNKGTIIDFNISRSKMNELNNYHNVRYYSDISLEDLMNN